MPHTLAIIPFKWSRGDPQFLNCCLLFLFLVSQESRPMLHTMAPLINSSKGPAKKKEKTKTGLVKTLGNAAMDGPAFQKANNFDKILPSIHYVQRNLTFNIHYCSQLLPQIVACLLQVKGFTKSHLGRGGVMGNLATMMPSDFWDRGARDSVTFMLSWKMVRSIATVGVLFQKLRLEFSTWKIK